MKTNKKFLLVPLIAAAFSLSLGLSVTRADDGIEGGDDILGTESLDIEFAMTPTAAAPAGSSIQASLEAEDNEGTADAKLKLETHGLTAGTYSVNVTLKSDGSTVALGSFTADGSDAEVEFESEEGNFPANVNPFDIATVSVLDANNVVIFTADLTNATTVVAMTRNATVRATAGPGNPGASGDGILSAFLSQGTVKGAVQLNGHGLSPNMPLTVAINGASVRNAKTDKTGNISVRLTPKGKAGTVASGVTLFTVKSISVNSKAGNTVLSASF